MEEDNDDNEEEEEEEDVGKLRKTLTDQAWSWWKYSTVVQSDVGILQKVSSI